MSVPTLDVTPQLVLAVIIIVGAFALRFFNVIDNTVMNALITLAIGLIVGTAYTKYKAKQLNAVK